MGSTLSRVGEAHVTSYRWKAPQEDGGILAAPNLADFDSLVRSNRKNLAAWDAQVTDLRRLAVEEALEAARQFHAKLGLPTPKDTPPALLITGHQPELFHPGVWIKNFALSSLAREHGLTPLNLIVDGDIVKSPAIRVPEKASGVCQRPDACPDVRVEHVPYAPPVGPVPHEEFDVSDENMFDGFANAVENRLKCWNYSPLLPRLWDNMKSIGRRTNNVGERLTAGRRLLEEDWGCHNLEVPMSQLCHTQAFARFACQILADLPRFHSLHNECLGEYRNRYGVRSRNHPVPDLHQDGDWLETPFWVWRAKGKGRERLMARRQREHLVLAMQGEAIAKLCFQTESSSTAAVTAFRELEGRGFKVRTRAISTTMFCRLLLADVFIHGIGGAIYDELTDELVRRFYGVEPPGFMVLSGTLRLPCSTDKFSNLSPQGHDELAGIGRQLRDLDYNPDRHLSESQLADPTIAALRQDKKAWISRLESPCCRRSAFFSIRNINRDLQPFVAERRNQYLSQKRESEKTLRSVRIRNDREYAYCLHSVAEMKAWLHGFLASG